MMPCRSCGKELTDDANFCPNCGFRTEKGESDNIKTPVDRRPDWEKDVEVALKNASKLMEEAFTAAKAGLKQVADELDTELNKAKQYKPQKSTPVYCPKCGNKNPSDSVFCTKCGKEITQ